MGMFERFTDHARQVVVLAQEEARALGHPAIGSEHILLGLLREEEGLASRVLGSLGVEIEAMRERVAQLAGRGDHETTGQIPFTPGATKVLELSLREALALGHNYIGTEHILLGIAREKDGMAARVLLDAGLDAETVRSALYDVLGEPVARAAPSGRWPRVRPRARRFEYRVLQLAAVAELTDDLLSPLGEDRWQLVAAVPEGAGIRVVLMRTA
jgi:ATP-dependent Clp protease ATP-binding subunit ClpC